MSVEITKKEYNQLVKHVADALKLASTHDPDLLRRIEVLERQVERMGAPQYRLVRRGKTERSK